MESRVGQNEFLDELVSYVCNTVQEERLTNEDTHHLLLLYKQVHDNRGIAEFLCMTSGAYEL